MNVTELKTALDRIDYNSLIRATLSNKKNQLCTYKKLSLKRTDSGFHVERLTEKQAFHDNIKTEAVPDLFLNELIENFDQLNCSCEGFDFDVKISKKGKLLINKKSNSASQVPITSHNRKKNYIFDEGIFVPALYELGIMTSDGKLVASKQDKFRQINRFTECVDDCFRDASPCTRLEIVDFGCGKSYLTFVLYYYFSVIRKLDVSIVGLDLKKDVIEKCNSIAKKYNYTKLKFICGDIKDYKPSAAPDMVITLHACDVATDYALYNAILWNSKYIFSVPCCQHELNTNSKLNNLELMGQYGLIKERFCALATDAQRARILEYCGYKTDILEFIDMDNSPKNILIRAKKTSTNEYKKKLIRKELDEFSQTFGTKLTLQKLIFDQGE